MSAFDIIPIRAFSDKYVWTMRDATSAALVDSEMQNPSSIISIEKA